MKILNIGAGDIKRIAKTKKIVVFGAGRILEATLKRFRPYHLEEDIAYIVDNNQEIWNSEKVINGKRIEIYSPEYMRKHISRQYILVIMVKKYSAILKQLSGYREMKHIRIYKYPTHYYLAEKRYKRKCPDKRLYNTVIANGEGDNHENAQAVFEYFRDNGLLGKYRWVWLCAHPEKYVSDKNVKYIARDIYRVPDTLQNIHDYWRARWTSRYIFFENIFLYKKRQDQISVYLKHGTFMLKNVKGKISIPEEVDGAICTSGNYAELAAEQESIDISKLIICGSPRLDFLYKDKHVLESLGFYKKDKRYVLWLPTLRQTIGLTRNDVKTVAPYGIPLVARKTDFDKLENKLEECNAVLMIKPHPHQELSVYQIGEYKNIVLIPQARLDEYEFPIHSLMRESDALITDYSSIAFDYMLLDRPIAYTVDDMNDYSVGFSVEDPLRFMPGEKLESIDNMLDFLEHVMRGQDEYALERRRIRDYVHEYQDDKNSERFLKIMKMI